MKKNIKIQYIYHSGFSVELEGRQFIFDYYSGQIDLINLQGKNTFIFASHGHPDHYNPVIFEWQKENPSLKYILSSDIALPNEKYEEPNLYWLSPYEEIQVSGIQIKAYGSTDLGVSFLVQWAGVTMFHAGDLNWWHWWGETPEEIAKAEKEFKREISKIKGVEIDVAFFPVDPRLEHNYTLGADYFIQEIGPKALIPMHFGKNVDEPIQYSQKMKDKNTRTKVILLAKPLEKVLLDV